MKLINNCKITGLGFLSVLLVSIGTGCTSQPADDQNEDLIPLRQADSYEVTEEAILTDPPSVPPPITRNHPAKVIVNMEILEVEKEIAEGVTYTFWTFGGTVPGKFIRVREGDLVEFHLKNHPNNKLPHNIDLHAVTGPGGGAAASFTAPGHETVFSFRTINPGLYVYHCATAPVGMHIANGMYGLILVEPKKGLPKVDREYYVMQGDFYTRGKYGEAGHQPFSMEKALDERPDYVLFNGAVGSMVGDKAITALTGETVRLYVGNGGPNLVSSFHVIGEIFDRVFVEGGDLINHNVQSTLIPAGGATIVDFRVEVPGNLILVDHSIFRAFNKGALAWLKVEGPENAAIFSGKEREKVYHPEGGSVQTITSGEMVARKPAGTIAERISRGKNVYTSVCLACHQPSGQGITGVFPPLAASDYLNTDINKAISAVVNGLSGEITVNKVKYNNIMPAVQMSDEDVANVITYVLNNWKNKGGEVTPEQVARIRKK